MLGWVYIITNQAMPGLVKVGFTERYPGDRADDFNRQHYGTAIPLRFVVAYAMRVKDPRRLERETHEALGKYRVTKQTEWFRCSVGEAAATIRRTRWRVGPKFGEIGPFETGTEIRRSPPAPPTVSYIERIRLANEHWLNQTALALLRENHITISGAGQHILTLLWEVAQYPTLYRLDDGWSLDESLLALENYSPEATIRFLIGADDDCSEICEEDMAQVNSLEDMFSLLREPIKEFLSDVDEHWLPDRLRFS